MSEKKQPLLAVVGPTASGKTALGAALAEEYGGEVVSADSMQIYKGLDVTSAKPTAEETRDIPHHLIGVVDMDADFSTADYVSAAEKVTSRTCGRNGLVYKFAYRQHKF